MSAMSAVPLCVCPIGYAGSVCNICYVWQCLYGYVLEAISVMSAMSVMSAVSLWVCPRCYVCNVCYV